MDDLYLFSNPVPPEMQAVSMAELAAVGMLVVVVVMSVWMMVGMTLGMMVGMVLITMRVVGMVILITTRFDNLNDLRWR